MPADITLPLRPALSDIPGQLHIVHEKPRHMFCLRGLRRVILLVSAILADEHLHDAVVTCGTSGNIDEHHAADVVLGYVVASLPAGQTLAAESPSWRCDRCHLESCNGSATFSGL